MSAMSIEKAIEIMQSGHICININKPILQGHRGYRVSTNAARCFSMCSLILCAINAKLTMLPQKVTPPPPLYK